MFAISNDDQVQILSKLRLKKLADRCKFKRIPAGLTPKAAAQVLACVAFAVLISPTRRLIPRSLTVPSGDQRYFIAESCTSQRIKIIKISVKPNKQPWQRW